MKMLFIDLIIINVIGNYGFKRDVLQFNTEKIC